MVQDHMVLDYKSRPKSPKSIQGQAFKNKMAVQANEVTKRTCCGYHVGIPYEWCLRMFFVEFSTLFPVQLTYFMQNDIMYTSVITL